MKIGYIASHLYRFTFEINEVSELIRRRPGTRVYSFYRPSGGATQTERLADFPAEIIHWTPASVVRGLVQLAGRHPLRVLAAAVELGARSLPNPVYLIKNAAAFLVALPILNDARRSGVTHLHANFGSSPATVAWLGKRILGATMSVTYHSFDIYLDWPSYRDPLKRRKLRDADRVAAVHQRGLQHLMQLVPDAPRDKFCLVRISVVFRPEDSGGSPREPGSPLLVAAGNLIRPKGFDVLVRAVAILARGGMDVRARILGEGPERPHLEAMVAAEGVGDRVELPGFYQHSRLAGHLAEATALVMPSMVVKGQHDGMPTVVVEAWLSRVPVVASLVGGMSEVIVDGHSGLVFEPGDAHALATTLRSLLESDELRQKLIEGGVKTAAAEFSPEANVGKLLREIESIGTALTPDADEHRALGAKGAREALEPDAGDDAGDHVRDGRKH